MKYLLSLILLTGCAAPKKVETKTKPAPIYRFYPNRMEYHCPFPLDEVHRNLYNSNSH